MVAIPYSDDKPDDHTEVDIPIEAGPPVTPAERAAIAAALVREEGRRKATLLRTQLDRPKTWKQLRDAGLTRAEVFAAIDALIAQGEIIVTVGPIMLERLDAEGGAV